ncbi:SDR family oxidoreductase [Brevibacterium salitolerans]|uniref:SDR family NAD(P)-dependent oxidoreductase n=1 Tax=Brevibacterium salitolerans TaxID=1403566 RepID=A0ABN2WP36_9MICO
MAWPAGETALVTGAASGIGLGISRALVAAGAKVALVDIAADRLAAAVDQITAGGGEAIALEFDVSDPEAWQDAADRAEQALGPVSIVCSNAGVSGGGPLDQISLDVWRFVQRINIDAQFLAISTFLPRMKARGGRAHIMSTASQAGLVPMANVGAYVASKFASVGLALSLREELRGSDIGVSVLCPGTVATHLARTDAEVQAKQLNRDFSAEAVEQNDSLLTQGADPDRVGEQVVEAMQNGDFFIVTHVEWQPLVQRVHDEIAQAYADFDRRHGVDPTPAILLSGADAAQA